MKRKSKFPVLTAALLFAGGVFFLLSCSGKVGEGRPGTETGVNYYTCGMHPAVRVSPADYERGNKNCPICNMNLVPVMKKGSASEKSGGAEKKKVLFYRNPMNPLITSRTPAKDEMGMDYVPVYADEADGEEYYGDGMRGAEHVYTLKELEKLGVKNMECPVCGMKLKKISAEEADRLKGVVRKVSVSGKEAELAGVESGAAAYRRLYGETRAPARVAYDRELYGAQKEYLAVLRLAGKLSPGAGGSGKIPASALLESAERKLFILGMEKKEVEELRARGKADESLILPSEKAWVYGDVPESENYWIRAGDRVEVRSVSFPGESFRGKIVSVKPIVNDKTRTLVFRARVENPGLKLKPEMFADALIKRDYEGGKKVLSVPADAVLDTGRRKIVWIENAGGKYEARIVRVGPEGYAYGAGGDRTFYPVISGLKAGEKVVENGNFLIDSQSRISGVSSAYGGSLAGE